MDQAQEQLSYIATTINRHDTDIAVINERLLHVGVTIEEIKDNHLAHLKDEVEEMAKNVRSIDKKIAYYTGAAAVIVTVGNLLFNYFTR